MPSNCRLFTFHCFHLIIKLFRIEALLQGTDQLYNIPSWVKNEFKYFAMWLLIPPRVGELSSVQAWPSVRPFQISVYFCETVTALPFVV